MAGEDPKRLARIRELPCCKCGGSPSDPHHPTYLRHTGKDAKRAHDRYAIPMCFTCHRALHDLNGPFKGWTREQLREWQGEMIEQLTFVDT